jgi:hypothetical protein
MQKYIRLLSAGNFSGSSVRALKLAVFINRIRQAGNRFGLTRKVFNLAGNRWFYDRDLAADRLDR